MQRSGAMARPLPTRRAAEALVCDGETFHCPLPEIWDCTLCQPNQDMQHHFCSTTLKSGLFVKPWELGGHPQNFLKSTRSTRSDDPLVHYERGKALERHCRLLAEADAWRRRVLFRDNMVIQISKLQAVEKQRSHFNELRGVSSWNSCSGRDPNQGGRKRRNAAQIGDSAASQMITKGKSHCIDHVVSVGAVSVEEQSDLSLPKHSLNKSFVILIKTGMLFMTIFFFV
ncbi:uncharacterized protein [Physcomitrium patens]|uniref:uncharacterized protein n=1 Tax=Physcomitrium patens TaxID=3218 RepID=UPI003CCD3381